MTVEAPAQASHVIVWVDQPGLAQHPDDPSVLVRCALGAFGAPGSLWDPDPQPVPWLSEALFEQAMSAIADDETADPDLVDQLLANAEANAGGFAEPPSARPVLVPLVHAPVFDDRIKRLGLSGGRNSMKSWSAVTWAVLKLATEPIHIVFAREFQASIAASSYRAVVDRIGQLGLTGFTIQRTRILHDNGGSITFVGLDRNPDSVRSMENIGAFVVEEAHRISQRSIRTLEPTLRKPGARILYIWNRVQPNDPVDRLFYHDHDKDEVLSKLDLGDPEDRQVAFDYLTEHGRNPVLHTTWEDNPFVSITVIGEVLQDYQRDRVTADHVWGGRPLLRSDARVFPAGSYTVADCDEAMPQNIVALFGADWGYANDPTVLVQVYVWGRTLYIRREAYGVRIPVDEVPALFAGSDRAPERWQNPRGFPGIPGAVQARIYGDSAGPTYIKHLKDRGFRNIRAVKKGPGSVENGIAKMHSFDIVVHPDCVRTLQELERHQYEVDTKTDEILPKFVDTDNHCIDAIRYAISRVK